MTPTQQNLGQQKPGQQKPGQQKPGQRNPGRGTERRRGRDAVPIVSVRAASAASVLMIVLLTVLIYAVVVGWNARATAEQIATNRVSLRGTAGEIVAQVFSVDATRWQADRARARALVGDEFMTSFGSQLRRGPADGTAWVRWEPGSVAVADVNEDRGTALIAVEVLTRAADGTQTSVPHTVRAEFGWRAQRWVLTSIEVLT